MTTKLVYLGVSCTQNGNFLNGIGNMEQKVYKNNRTLVLVLLGLKTYKNLK